LKAEKTNDVCSASLRSPLFVAIIGGSGSGKSWLSERLHVALGPRASRLSLDSFYRDRSHVPEKRRALINFDHPVCIDWAEFERVLRACADNRDTSVPIYDFKTHSRLPVLQRLQSRPVILVDGLWLLRRVSTRAFFQLKIFLECSVQSRLERRISRDLISRGRMSENVKAQFWKTVQPMHKKFVHPQRQWADLVLRGNWGQAEVNQIVQKIRLMRGEGLFQPETDRKKRLQAPLCAG
jgi:uridine kinase